MKKHVIIVSSKFLKAHPRAGEETGFPQKVIDGTKIHTLRMNYPYWKKKIDEVNAGIAELHVRTWSGKPFVEPQKEVKIFGKGEVGIQKCTVSGKGEAVWFENEGLFLKDIEKNDGLSYEDFWSWFTKDADDVAIIHFTKFRY